VSERLRESGVYTALMCVIDSRASLPLRTDLNKGGVD